MEQPVVDFSFLGMIMNMSLLGWGVGIALIIMSIWSFSITFDRWWAFKKSRNQSLKAMNEAYEQLEKDKLEDAIAATRKYPGGNLARIMGAALTSALADKQRHQAFDLDAGERAVE